MILGGTGRMGRWFTNFFKEKGFDVAIFSRSRNRALQASRELDVNYIQSLTAVNEADIVLVSTSLESTVAIIREVSKSMKPNSILFDIASIKSGVIEALEDAHTLGIRTISIHPMFGPGTTSIKGKHLLVIPVGDDPKLVTEMINLFKDAQIHILKSGKTHDELMAIALSLPHFLNIVFGKILTHSDLKEIMKVSGTTFALQLLVTEAVYSEDPELYYEIQSHNLAFANLLDEFLKSVTDATFIIKRKDKAAFIRSFNQVKTELSKDPNFMHAYHRFYRAYETTI